MKFKIGDHVRVISRTDRYFDEVGMVVEIDAAPDRPFRVSGLFSGYPLYYAAHELILAEPEPQTATQDATGVAEGEEVPGGEFGALREAPSDPVKHPTITDADKLRMIADTVHGQTAYGTELANFRRRLLAILSIGRGDL